MNIGIPLVFIFTDFQSTLGITKANDKPPQNDESGQNLGGTIYTMVANPEMICLVLIQRSFCIIDTLHWLGNGELFRKEDEKIGLSTVYRLN